MVATVAGTIGAPAARVKQHKQHSSDGDRELLIKAVKRVEPVCVDCADCVDFFQQATIRPLAAKKNKKPICDSDGLWSFLSSSPIQEHLVSTPKLDFISSSFSKFRAVHMLSFSFLQTYCFSGFCFVSDSGFFLQTCWLQ